VRAFEEEALDYVLKPYRADRLARTLARLRQQAWTANSAATTATTFLSRVAVKKSARIHLVKMSVPLSWDADGLPIGVHFAGRFGDEATLFRLAAQLESAHPWAAHRPPLQGL
jgi:Asp-tRNA(Asn)/Glu-tRNA(Gln) amidotransferase A subunit family amidase